MDTKISEVQPMAVGPKGRYDQGLQDSQLIQPVTKADISPKSKVDAGYRLPREQNTPAISHDKLTALAEEAQAYLDDLNIEIQFEVYDKTGDVVVRVMNRATGDVIRQIPTNDVLAFREKLKELRGVLFNGQV